MAEYACMLFEVHNEAVPNFLCPIKKVFRDLKLVKKYYWQREISEIVNLAPVPCMSKALREPFNWKDRWPFPTLFTSIYEDIGKRLQLHI